jgi:dihydroorotate dehydrogenase electron transfer subunit
MNSGKVSLNAKVCENIEIGPHFYRLKLELDQKATTAFSDVSPGEFVELDLSKLALPAKENIPDDLLDASLRQIILRRPFSFCDVERSKGNNPSGVIVGILYCVVGPATLRMTTLNKGDNVNMIGPLGNGFSVLKGKKYALLVAGGMGAPPLLYLAKTLKMDHTDIDIVSMIGAMTENALPIGAKDFARYTSKQMISTDDGSAGNKGFVTSLLDKWLSDNCRVASETMIYSCGPEPMLAEVAKLASKYNVDCQISMERLMACGIGICQSCAVEAKTLENSETVYKLCCKDGPVFNSKDVVLK